MNNMLINAPDASIASSVAAVQQQMALALVNSPLGGESTNDSAAVGGKISAYCPPTGLQEQSPLPLRGGASQRHAHGVISSAADLPTLIAVSKGQPAAAIAQAMAAGLRDVGENRVQEAAEKWPEIKAAYPDARLHLIGPLQSNKVREAVALFDVIQTVDRLKIAQALAEEAARVHKTLPCFMQVNIGEEPQKHGVMPRELAALLAECQALPALSITGLMAVPPAGVNPAPYFALLATLAKRHGLPHLSMGMSGDFITALRLGATHIRLGTALFGTRM